MEEYEIILDHHQMFLLSLVLSQLSAGCNTKRIEIDNLLIVSLTESGKAQAEGFDQVGTNPCNSKCIHVHLDDKVLTGP